MSAEGEGAREVWHWAVLNESHDFELCEDEEAAKRWAKLWNERHEYSEHPAFVIRFREVRE